MKRVTLPRSHLAVSPLCLGVNQFGTAQTGAAAAAIVETFFAAGGNFFDTARSYGDWIPGIARGASERLLVALLKGRPRGDYVLATKGCEFDARREVTGSRVTP